MDKFGNLVKNEREKRGWSQSLLARKSGVSQSSISRLELGEDVKITNRTKELILEAFGIIDKSRQLSDFDIIQNALLQCPSLDEWDRAEILQTVKLKLDRKAKQKAPPVVPRGKHLEAGG